MTHAEHNKLLYVATNWASKLGSESNNNSSNSSKSSNNLEKEHLIPHLSKQREEKLSLM